MKKLYFILLAFLTFGFTNAQEVIITGYFDSPCPSQLGRTVEIYVDGTVDLTNWNLVRQSNGGGFVTNIDLSALGSLTDSFAYITNDAATLTAEFGISGSNVIVSSAINDNGDDAFQIINDTAAVIDRFGEDGVDATGFAWEHLDSYYYRVDGVPANGGAFNVVDFTFGALNVLDNLGLCNSAAALSTVVPFGTYSTTASTTPTVTVTGSVASLDYFEGNGPSAEDSFSVSGINLTQNITVSAPTNFEVSLTSGSGFASSVVLTQTGGTVNVTTVYVRLAAGLTANTYNGDVTASSTGATNQTLTLTGVVSPATPQFNVFGTPNDMNYSVGAGPSNEESIFVEGLFLTNNLTITAPTNFEVSLTSGSGFSSSVSITPSSGTVANTEVFIRLVSGLAIGNYNGDITVSSSPVADDTVPVNGNVFGSATNSLVIIGVYDGPNTGGVPKGVELFALADIPDLSLFGISSVTNGAGSNGSTIEFTFPADALTAGQSIFVATESTEFTNFFGFAPDYTTGVVGINGDDAVELYENGTIIDTFGDVNADGTGTPWEYLDGWAYRVSNTGPDGTSFVIGNWTFSGINQLEGGTTNSACAVPYPLNTYTNNLATNNFNTIEGLTMYPNPVSGNVVNFTSATNAEMNVQIFDILGKEVVKANVVNNTLNIGSLNAGVYIVKVTEAGKTATKKLVVR